MRNFLFVSFLFLSQAYHSQKIDNQPLNIGSTAPKIVGKNQDNETISSSDYINEKAIVLIFYRGEWCGYCKRHLSNLQDSLNLISEKGAEVIVVTPEQPKYVKKMIKKTGASYNILSDKDLKIMEDYNVKYAINDSTVPKYTNYVENVTEKQNNNGEAVLPIPATYIIGKDGKIKWYHFDPKYSKRSTVKEILINL